MKFTCPTPVATQTQQSHSGGSWERKRFGSLSCKTVWMRSDPCYHLCTGHTALQRKTLQICQLADSQYKNSKNLHFGGMVQTGLRTRFLWLANAWRVPDWDEEYHDWDDTWVTCSYWLSQHRQGHELWGIQLTASSSDCHGSCDQVLLKKVRGTAVGDVDYKDKAETLWIKASQRTLQSDKKFPQWKRQFDLFEDSAMLWRCRGRLQNVDASISTVHPILLNKNHHLTTLFIHKANNQLYIMVSKPHSLSWGQDTGLWMDGVLYARYCINVLYAEELKDSVIVHPELLHFHHLELWKPVPSPTLVLILLACCTWRKLTALRARPGSVFTPAALHVPSILN